VLERVQATRFVAPLREGGSLPGIVEADDLGTYVVKFRGAGQGVKVLVAEIIVARLARRLGLRVPELRLIDLAPEIAMYEADEEVQELLNASIGLNLAVDFLPGAFGWEAGLLHGTQAQTYGPAVLWLDALTANVDRCWRNPNVLMWHRQLWLIDHGAALYFHHGWANRAGSPSRFAEQPYDATDHVMASFAGQIAAADERLAPLITSELLDEVLGDVPDEWLELTAELTTAAAVRSAYREHLLARVSGRRPWLPTGAAA